MVVRIVWCVLNRLLKLGHKQIMGNDRNARSAQHVNFLLIKNTAGMLGEFQCWSLSRKLVERKAFDFRSSVGLSCTMLISTDSSGKCSILFFLLLLLIFFFFYHLKKGLCNFTACFSVLMSMLKGSVYVTPLFTWWSHTAKLFHIVLDFKCTLSMTGKKKIYILDL